MVEEEWRRQITRMNEASGLTVNREGLTKTVPESRMVNREAPPAIPPRNLTARSEVPHRKARNETPPEVEGTVVVEARIEMVPKAPTTSVEAPKEKVPGGRAVLAEALKGKARGDPTTSDEAPREKVPGGNTTSDEAPRPEGVPGGPTVPGAGPRATRRLNLTVSREVLRKTTP